MKFTERFKHHMQAQCGNDFATGIYRMEHENEEMRKLLRRAGKFSLFSNVTSGTGNAYLRTKASDWCVIQQEIHNFLKPKPPITINMEVSPQDLSLRVWLERGGLEKNLALEEDYHLDQNGIVRLHGTFEELWG